MGRKTGIILYIIIIAVLLCVPSYGEESVFPKPTEAFFINDFAGILDSGTEQYIQSIAVDLQKKTTAQVVVVTIKSLQGESLEEYAVKLFREWGIGTAEKNNGLLLLVAVEDRMLRVEVGYGLEGAIPDSKAGRIQDEYIIPYFQKGDYNSGVVNGFLAIVSEIYKEYGIEIDNLGSEYNFGTAERQERDNGSGQFIFVILVIIVLIIDWMFLGGRITRMFFIASMYGRRGGGGSHRGGGFRGGGGFSGGGGRSGGGGSSGRW